MNIVYLKRYHVGTLTKIADSAPDPKSFDAMNINVHALLDDAVHATNYGAYTKARVEDTEYHALATIYPMTVDGYEVELVAASSNL